MLFSSRVKVKIRVRIRFSLWLVSCHAHVFVLLSTVIVTLSSMVSLLFELHYLSDFRVAQLYNA